MPDTTVTAVADTPAPGLAVALPLNAHARFIVEKYDSEGAWPRFARNAVTGCVHVMAPADTQPAYADNSDGTAAAVFDFALGRHLMVCGITLTFHRAGVEQGAHLLQHFDDNDLCARCHRAFGENAWILFEFNPRLDAALEATPMTVTPTTTPTPPPPAAPAAGRPAHNPPTEYLVKFDRIGRTHDITLHARATSLGELANVIAAYARPFLRSEHYQVAIDTHKNEGTILCGLHVGGTFTIDIPDADADELRALDDIDTGETGDTGDTGGTGSAGSP